MRQSYFTPALFTFLREVEQNNNKPWWDENKDRYIRIIRDPAKEFIADFEPRLQSMSDHFLADTRTNGGSLMRPYRDTRFSKDKTPYKTNVGIQFRHEMGKDVHAPGFYVHLEPGACFAGIGIWHPEPKVARQIREAIYQDPDAWKKATKYKAFTNVWALDVGEEDRLKRIPKEFDDGSPYADDLRMKSFIAGHKFTQKAISSPEFDADLAKVFKAGSAFNAFLCNAIGVPY
ncbi:MAG: TIGR02453 family protein [Actinomycetia bacterium]|nr:TIGR02453 family protein [Actinomycetes bacterium]